MLMAAAPICCHQFHGRSCEERRVAMFRSVRGEGGSRNQHEERERAAREFSRESLGGVGRGGRGGCGGEQRNNEMHVHTHHFTFSWLNKNVILGIFFLLKNNNNNNNPQSGM